MSVKLEPNGKRVSVISNVELKKALGNNKKRNAKIKKELIKRGVSLEEAS